MEDEKVVVMIKKEIYDKAKEKIYGTSISSVEEYIEHLLENELIEEREYTPEEVELLRERLKSLGPTE